MTGILYQNVQAPLYAVKSRYERRFDRYTPAGYAPGEKGDVFPVFGQHGIPYALYCRSAVARGLEYVFFERFFEHDVQFALGIAYAGIEKVVYQRSLEHGFGIVFGREFRQQEHVGIGAFLCEASSYIRNIDKIIGFYNEQ